MKLQSTGRTYTLQAPLASGGEGDIYPVPDDPRRLIKIYREPSAGLAGKLHAMIAGPPMLPPEVRVDISLAWPIGVVTDAHHSGRVVGYEMPHIQNAKSLLSLSNPVLRDPKVDQRFLYRVARNLARGVAALHEQGIVIGDLHPTNVLAADNARVTFIDTDSFQIRTLNKVFYCGVGRPDFTPPELHGVHLGERTRETFHDTFALAVIVYMLLCDGNHVFSAAYLGNDTRLDLTERIKLGFWPYARNRKHEYGPRRNAPGLETLPTNLQHLMHRCFDDGYRDPPARPTAQQWFEALVATEPTKALSARIQRQSSHMPGADLHQRVTSAPLRRAGLLIASWKYTAAAALAMLVLTVLYLCGRRSDSPAPQAYSRQHVTTEITLPDTEKTLTVGKVPAEVPKLQQHLSGHALANDAGLSRPQAPIESVIMIAPPTFEPAPPVLSGFSSAQRAGGPIGVSPAPEDSQVETTRCETRLDEIPPPTFEDVQLLAASQPACDPDGISPATRGSQTKTTRRTAAPTHFGDSAIDISPEQLEMFKRGQRVHEHAQRVLRRWSH